MKSKISFRILCAIFGFLFIYLSYQTFLTMAQDKDSVPNIFIVAGLGFYFLYYAFWQGRNRIPETVKKAETGNLEAQLQLAQFYRWDKKGKKNYTEAFKWYMMAAEQGDSAAFNNLGSMYLMGDGVDQCNEKAFQAFQTSAEKGNDSSQFNIGIMHYEGLGIPMNKQEAMKWFRLAAEQGNREAKTMLAEITKE